MQQKTKVGRETAAERVATRRRSLGVLISMVMLAATVVGIINSDPVAAAPGDPCSGPVVHTDDGGIDKAKSDFAAACGHERYDDQQAHKCDWVSNPDGWRCSGGEGTNATSEPAPAPVPRPESPDTPAPDPASQHAPASSGTCENTNRTTNDLDAARSSFAQNCGRAWDRQADKCEWQSQGWYCFAPGSTGDGGQPPAPPSDQATTSAVSTTTETSARPEPTAFGAPRITGASSGADGIVVEWERVEGAVKYNVFRNGVYLTTILDDGGDQRYLDRAANTGDSYVYRIQAEDGLGGQSTSESDPVAHQVVAQSSIPVIHRLGVSTTTAGAILSWSIPHNGRPLQVFRFRPVPDVENVPYEEFAGYGTSIGFTSRQTNDLFLVVQQENDRVVGATGLYNVSGSCIAICTPDDWRNVAQTMTRAVPAIAAVVVVVATVIREAGRRAVQWCASNPRDCSRALNDAATVGSDLADRFSDNPASIVAGETVDDFVDQGFTVDSVDDDSQTVTMSNGDTTVTVQVLVTQPGEAGNVLTTTTNNTGPNGQIGSREISYRWVSERLLNDSPVVNSQVQTFETFYYDLEGNLIGKSTQSYRDGVLIGTDCEGEAAATGCSSTTTPTNETTQTSFTLPDLTTPTTRPENFVTTIARTTQTTRPENFVTTQRPTTTRRPTTTDGGSDTSSPSATSPPGTTDQSIERCRNGGGC